MRANIAAILLLVACTSAKPKDDTLPTLAIDGPERGTLVDGETVSVTGHAADDGTVRVTVNGADVPVAKDGSFTTTVTVGAGIDVIETHALDTTGHDIRDVRAVLAGPLGTSDGGKVAPIGAHASAAALATIGKAMAADAKAVDYTAAVQGLNPVYNNGGCLGAVIDITSVTLSNIDVALVPVTDALSAKVTIDNVVVKLHANYKVACIGGGATITVTASAAHVDGNLGVALANGKLVTALPNASVVLDGFDLNVSGVPGPIADLFNSVVRGKVESALTSAIQSKVPPIANAKLAGLLAKPFDASVLGHDTKLTVTPTSAAISPTGIYVGVDTKVLVTGGAGGMFLTAATDDAATLMGQTSHLGLAIANDLVNQLFSGLWAAGAFNKTVAVASLGVLGSLLDPDATKLALSLSLPPTVASDGAGKLQLSIGDAIISVQNDAGVELQRIALSLQTALAAEAGQAGTIAMTLGTPKVYAQMLGQVDDGSRPLSAMQIEGIVTGAWGVLSGQASAALAKLPLPAIAGVQLGAPTVGAVGNYVLADIPLQ